MFFFANNRLSTVSNSCVYTTAIASIFVVGPTKLLFSIKIIHGMMFFYNSNYYYTPLTFSSKFSMLKDC